VILRFHTLGDTEIDVTVRLSTSKRFRLLPEVPRSSFVPHLSLDFWVSAREGVIGSCLYLPNRWITKRRIPGLTISRQGTWVLKLVKTESNAAANTERKAENSAVRFRGIRYS